MVVEVLPGKVRHWLMSHDRMGKRDAHRSGLLILWKDRRVHLLRCIVIHSYRITWCEMSLSNVVLDHVCDGNSRARVSRLSFKPIRVELSLTGI